MQKTYHIINFCRETYGSSRDERTEAAERDPLPFRGLDDLHREQKT